MLVGATLVPSSRKRESLYLASLAAPVYVQKTPIKEDHWERFYGWVAVGDEPKSERKELRWKPLKFHKCRLKSQFCHSMFAQIN